jgi:glucose-1-phosphate thymidylyltransferase
MKIGCVEEVAYHKGFITAEQLATVAARAAASDYGRYLLQLLDRGQ